MMYRLAASLLCVLGILNCGGTQEPKVAPQFSKLRELEKQAGEKYAHVVSEIEAYLEQAPCASALNTSPCEMVNVGFEAKKPAARSKGQRILVIDQGMRLAAYTRYKSRVLNDLAPDEKGVYRPVNEKVELPAPMFHVLSTILDEKHPSTPAIALQRVKKKNNGSALSPSPNYLLRHGDFIFGTLADLNPDAEFIIAQSFNMPDGLDALGPEEISDRAGEYFDHAADSLISVIREYDISLVNMSFGHTTESIAKSLAGRIRPELASTNLYRGLLKLAKERFYDRLFSLRDVIFVQSGPEPGAFIEEGDSDFLNDCSSYDNRLRAGYIEKLWTDVPAQGEKREALLEQQNARKCIDVFFNSGVKIDPELGPVLGAHPYLGTMNGIGRSNPDQPFSSSWAAPFVLSFVNFHKQEALAKGESFSIERFRNSQLVIEPVKYRQLEIFRTGRL